jgi:hypothetical protein
MKRQVNTGVGWNARIVTGQCPLGVRERVASVRRQAHTPTGVTKHASRIANIERYSGFRRVAEFHNTKCKKFRAHIVPRELTRDPDDFISLQLYFHLNADTRVAMLDVCESHVKRLSLVRFMPTHD